MDNNQQLGQLRKQPRQVRTANQRNGVMAEDWEGALVADDSKQAVPQDALLTTDQGYNYKGFIISPTGLLCPENVKLEDWLDLGHVLNKLDTSIQWSLGDWLAFSEQTEWGKSVAEVVAQYNYSEQTLYDYTWVCRNVNFSIRNRELSFSHHRLIAGLQTEHGETDVDQQVYWLNEAHENKWTVSQMRKAMNPPAPSELVDKVLRFEGSINSQLRKFEKDIAEAGKGERLQISQITDNAIAALQKFQKSLKR